LLERRIFPSEGGKKKKKKKKKKKHDAQMIQTGTTHLTIKSRSPIEALVKIISFFWMKGFLSLKQALASSGGHVRVSGWIRSVRKQKNVAFVSLFDGSGARDLQVVLAPNQLPEVATAGASVCVEGSMTTSPGSKQSKELAATRLVVVGPCDDRSFPLQKKEHSEEFLREIGHLRARTSVFAAVMRLRHATGLAMSQYLNGEGFVQVHCPVIVSGDCEGAGEMFRVSDSSSKSPFFGKDAFLTVSAQLHGEAFACGMSRVYSFGPTFRAERHSKTAHHLAEFWMLEPEFAFADLSQLIQLAEGTVRSGLECVLSSHLEDLEVIGLRKKEQLQVRSQLVFLSFCVQRLF
jgi:asparaginyl-tRNA synthetase